MQAKALHPPEEWNTGVQRWFDRAAYVIAMQLAQEIHCKKRGGGGRPEREPDDPPGQGKDLTDEWYRAQSRFLEGYGQMAARLDRAFQQHGLAGQRQAIEDALTTVLKFDIGVISAVGHALHHLG
ncbi:MAG: hypothetical protein M1826_003679 [Phylliscum demangeonii]|nr:MAG: hypothetical protein M1826_003679 [Phylliscum demangeonii]